MIKGKTVFTMLLILLIVPTILIGIWYYFLAPDTLLSSEQNIAGYEVSIQNGVSDENMAK